MTPWFAPDFDASEERRIAAVLRSGYVNDGPVTREFEREIARRVGRKYAVACTSGTAAIALALMASVRRRRWIGRDDVVGVPDFTFIATANAVRLAGANVMLCDVDRETMCLDATKIEEYGKTARAMVAVEVNGRRPDYQALSAFTGVLITDSCESLGAPGLATAGACSCLSFSPAKIITTGQGGMVLTDDEKIYGRLIELKDQGRRHGGTGGNDDHPTLGFNFKFTDLQAAVGLAQLEKIDFRIATINHRNEIYRAYLGGDPGFRLWFDIVHENRDAIAAALRAGGYDCREFWKPLHMQGAYRTWLGSLSPNAGHLSRCGLWLPSSFGMTDDQLADVCRIVSRQMESANA
jgi:perosamine synthetase